MKPTYTGVNMRAVHAQQSLFYRLRFQSTYYLIVIGLLIGSFHAVYTAIPTRADSPDHQWEQSSLAADSSRNWVATASSSDGQKLAALDRSGYAYTSQDGGTTWTIRTSIGPNDEWSAIASSIDGMTLAVAARNGGSIYTSSDAGVTWTERTSAGSRNWWTISIAQNGTTMLAVDNGGYVYLSTDSGATWTAQTAAGTGTWASGEISENGQNIVVAIRGGLLKTSVNGGSTWTSHSGVGSRVWVDVDTSQDGTRMIASAYSGSLWLSTDSGVTWVAKTAAAGTKTWESVSMSADGMQIIAVINSTEAPKISRDGGTTWNFIFSNKNWADVATSGDGNTILMPGFGGLEGYVWITKDAGLTWSVAPVKGTADWRSISASSNGVVRVAAPETGYLYVSRDNGATWNEQVSLGRKPWRASAASSDGTKIAVAAGWGGAIYTSSDSGVTWAEKTTAGLRDWYGITISNDGQKIAAISYYDDLYTSTDGGTTWTAHAELGAGLGWSSITASTDGTKLAATVEYNSLIYTSSDSGVTWTAQSGSSVQDWYGIDTSSDGTELIATTGWGGAIYTSSDSGVTWAEKTAAGLRDWTSVALSQDGTKLVGVTYDDSIYISTDSGANWLPQTTPGVQPWTAVAMIDDGTIIAGGESTFIYNATATQAEIAPSSPQTVTVDTSIVNEATINWATPSSDGGAAITGYTLEYKLSSDGTWTSVDITTPTTTHNLTSLPAGQYDVRVSAINSVGTSPASTPVTFIVTSAAPDPTPSQTPSPNSDPIITLEPNNTPASYETTSETSTETVEQESTVTISPVTDSSHPGQIVINWLPPASMPVPPSGYVIEYRETSNSSDNSTPWQQVASVDGSMRTATITLPPGEYEIRVAALMPGETPTRVILGVARVAITGPITYGDGPSIVAAINTPPVNDTLRNWVAGCAASVMVAALSILPIFWKRRRKKAQSETMHLPSRRL